MASGIDVNVNPNEASILSMIAAHAGAPGVGLASYSDFVSRLDSDLAKEIANVLLGVEREVSPQAQETAEAMRRWYEAKRDRSRRAKQDVQSRRRRIIARASRLPR